MIEFPFPSSPSPGLSSGLGIGSPGRIGLPGWVSLPGRIGLPGRVGLEGGLDGGGEGGRSVLDLPVALQPVVEGV